jgi:hypothetical protein
MIRRSHLIGFATVLLVGCTPATKQATAPGSPTAAPTDPAPATAAAPVQKLAKAQPLGTIPVPAVPPGLVPQTNAQARSSGVAQGRVDPFAIVPSGPLVIPVKVATPAKPTIQPTTRTAIAPSKGASQSITASAAPSVVPLPAPGPLASPLTVSPLALPAMPAPSSTAIADSVAITGVLQLAGKWHVIVQESSLGASRYVGVGDSLAGGQVTVKRIVAGAEPLVVLQQNGKEVLRTVGSGQLASR